VLSRESAANVTGLGTASDGRPLFEVHSLRAAQRVGPDGNALNQVVASITQKRRLPLDEQDPDGDQFTFRGGCTLILDLTTLSLRYTIVKRIDAESRLRQQRSFMLDELGGSLYATYFAPLTRQGEEEPFAFLHRYL
jgi:hypothetical protein